MSNSKLWDDALDGADYEKKSEFAVEVPKVLAQASAGTASDVTRSTGLILTKEQIISIKKYVAIGLSFPDTLKGVSDYLRYGPGQDGGSGLTAQDFLATFTLIAGHARSWTPLRHRIMLTGTDLKQFGTKMQTWGRAMGRVYDSDDAVRLIKEHKVKTLEDLKKLQLGWVGVFPGIELDPDTVPELNDYLQEVRDRINEYQATTNGIKVDIDKFGNILEAEVIPSIKRRLALIGNNKYTGEVAALNKRITERADQIEELNSKYKALVEKALGSAAGMNIFGLGMAIYHGVEAEKVRAERNKINALQDADIQSLHSKEMTLGSLKRVEHDLQNTKIVAIDAEVATNNLRHVWNVIDVWVSDSKKSMDSINDALKLHKFMSKFEEVVDSWKEVANVADQLIAVFDQADKEYKTEHGVMSMMRFSKLKMVVAAGYPDVDHEVRSRTKQQMRQDRATLDSLFTTLKYLPGLHDRFSRLVDNVYSSARVLEDSAFKSNHELGRANNAIKRLKVSLERELNGSADEETISEIIDDCNEALTSVYDSVSKNASAIGLVYANISSSFDRQQTIGFISGLNNDVAIFEQTKKVLEEALTQQRAALKVVTDAVSVAEKAGLDDVSKDINLTIDKLKDLGIAPPQVQVVMLAVELLQKSIGDITKGISFSFIIAESKKLREKVNSTLENIALQGDMVVITNQKILFIETVYQIDEQVVLYSVEFKKVIDAFSQFLLSIDVGSDTVAERVDRFLNKVPNFLKFVAPLSLPNG